MLRCSAWLVQSLIILLLVSGCSSDTGPDSGEKFNGCWTRSDQDGLEYRVFDIPGRSMFVLDYRRQARKPARFLVFWDDRSLEYPEEGILRISGKGDGREQAAVLVADGDSLRYEIHNQDGLFKEFTYSRCALPGPAMTGADFLEEISGTWVDPVSKEPLFGFSRTARTLQFHKADAVVLLGGESSLPVRWIIEQPRSEHPFLGFFFQETTRALYITGGEAQLHHDGGILDFPVEPAPGD